MHWIIKHSVGFWEILVPSGAPCTAESMDLLYHDDQLLTLIILQSITITFAAVTLLIISIISVFKVFICSLSFFVYCLPQKYNFYSDLIANSNITIACANSISHLPPKQWVINSITLANHIWFGSEKWALSLQLRSQHDQSISLRTCDICDLILCDKYLHFVTN